MGQRLPRAPSKCKCSNNSSSSAPWSSNARSSRPSNNAARKNSSGRGRPIAAIPVSPPAHGKAPQMQNAACEGRVFVWFQIVLFQPRQQARGVPPRAAEFLHFGVELIDQSGDRQLRAIAAGFF